MIQKAVISDLEELYAITKSCAQVLIENQIFQWSENYPSKEILQKDIELQQVWKLTIATQIIGIIVLTEIEDAEYKNVQWVTNNNCNLYIHRLAIRPTFQGKGYAQQLMDFAEHYAEEKQYKSIRLDTFSQNKRNQQFYEKRNYTKLEAIYIPTQSEFPFYCYEKILDV